MSNDDFEDDPLNQGANRNWGNAEAMEDLAYLASDIELEKVGPIGLLSAAMKVIRERPMVLVLCGAIAGAASYGLDQTLGKVLGEWLAPHIGTEVAMGLEEVLTLLLVWSLGLLLQGPLTGAALEANSNKEGLLPKLSERATKNFKSLVLISFANGLFVCAVMAAWTAGLFALAKLAAVVGGFLGMLTLAVGGVASAFYSIGACFRLSLAPPILLVEGLEPMLAIKRSIELTRGSAGALAGAAFLPIALFFFATIFLGTFGVLNSSWAAMTWVGGFYIFYSMLCMAFVPAAYIVYRHYVDEIPPHKLAEQV
jgi:hypothetical protein